MNENRKENNDRTERKNENRKENKDRTEGKKEGRRADVTVYSSYSREVHTGKPGFTACSISNVHMDQ